jgi:hypothetical protein
MSLFPPPTISYPSPRRVPIARHNLRAANGRFRREPLREVRKEYWTVVRRLQQAGARV